jgi:hypothetical protein
MISVDGQVQFWGQASDIYGRHCSGTNSSSVVSYSTNVKFSLGADTMGNNTKGPLKKKKVAL